MSEFNGTAPLTEEELRERAVDRFNHLAAKISECEEIAERLPALRAELARTNAVIDALNGDKSVALVDPDPWACDVCPRSFSTRRGLSRHVTSAHTVDRPAVEAAQKSEEQF